jgi:hypothetical protein
MKKSKNDSTTLCNFTYSVGSKSNCIQLLLSRLNTDNVISLYNSLHYYKRAVGADSIIIPTVIVSSKKKLKFVINISEVTDYDKFKFHMKGRITENSKNKTITISY